MSLDSSQERQFTSMPQGEDEAVARKEQARIFHGFRELYASLVLKAHNFSPKLLPDVLAQVESGADNGGITIRFGEPGMEAYVPDSLYDLMDHVYGARADGTPAVRIQHVWMASEKGYDGRLGRDVDRVSGYIQVAPPARLLHLKELLPQIDAGDTTPLRAELALDPMRGVYMETPNGPRIRGTVINFAMTPDQTIFTVAGADPDTWEARVTNPPLEGGVIPPHVIGDLVDLVRGDQFPQNPPRDYVPRVAVNLNTSL